MCFCLFYCLQKRKRKNTAFNYYVANENHFKIHSCRLPTNSDELMDFFPSLSLFVPHPAVEHPLRTGQHMVRGDIIRTLTFHLVPEQAIGNNSFRRLQRCNPTCTRLIGFFEATKSEAETRGQAEEQGSRTTNQFQSRQN